MSGTDLTVVVAAVVVGGLVKSITGLGFQGKYANRWAAIAAVSVVVLITVPIGSYLRTRLPAQWFHRMVLVLLALSCVSIVVDLVGS